LTQLKLKTMSAQTRFDKAVKTAQKNGAIEREREDNIRELKRNINLLGWDYQRMSSSGQETYDIIEKLLRKI